MAVIDVVQLASDWDKARSYVCSLTTSDPRYRDALNKLAEAEDLMSKRVRQIGLGAR